MKIPNLANLDTLAFRFPGQDGRPKTGWAIYAEPIDSHDPLGPVRQVGDSDEGFSCVDDVARVALVYLDHFEATRKLEFAQKATAAVEFCLNQEDGRGHFYNFVENDGRINHDGPTSKPGLNWWTARAFYALGKAERLLDDPKLKEQIQASRQRTIDRLQEAHDSCEVHPDLQAAYRETGIRPGSLVDHSGSITSLFVLGLLEKLDPQSEALVGDYCDAMQKLSSDQPLLKNLHLNSLSDRTTVHLYGNHQTQALAEAGLRLNRPEWISSAQAEADAYPQILASHQLPFAYSPAPEPGPQIAYAAETTIANLQAVSKATGQERYSELAGLFGTWFSGANVAGKPVYDPGTGRSFDGVDPQGVSINSGAESNVETQLALGTLQNKPGQRLLDYASVQAFSGEQLRVGAQFEIAAGSPSQEIRTLNGGAQRQDWKLDDQDRLATPSHHGQLVWKSSGGPLIVDPDGPGPLPAQEIAAQGPGWQTTSLADSPRLELGGQVTIDSLVERPAVQQRTWSNGSSKIRLTVSADGWEISEQ
jgi:hypothetical protein